MSKQVYKMDNTFKNSFELLKKFLTLYGVTLNMEKGKNYLRPKLIEILAYYLLKGYSDETKQFILESHSSMKKTNLNQINSELQKKGLLMRDKYKYHHRHVSSALNSLKQYVDENIEHNPIFVIKFNLKEHA